MAVTLASWVAEDHPVDINMMKLLSSQNDAVINEIIVNNQPKFRETKVIMRVP